MVPVEPSLRRPCYGQASIQLPEVWEPARDAVGREWFESQAMDFRPPVNAPAEATLAPVVARDIPPISESGSTPPVIPAQRW
jgi:hypothetical protein